MFSTQSGWLPKGLLAGLLLNDKHSRLSRATSFRWEAAYLRGRDAEARDAWTRLPFAAGDGMRFEVGMTTSLAAR